MITPKEVIEHLRLYLDNEAYTDKFQDICKMAIEAFSFKVYFDELYGQGLEVANWHLNGDLEPFDNFYEQAIDWSEGE